MDLIVVEPLNLMPPTALVPYSTFEDGTLATEGFGGEGKLPLGESKC